MAEFSASDAALEGFQVLRRHWRVAVGWCLFSVIGFVAVVAAAFVAILVVTLAAGSNQEASAVGTAIGALVIGPGALIVEIMVVSALYRVMLRPDEPPGLVYLRLSKDELRLFGLWAIIIAGFAVLMALGYLVLSPLGRVSGIAEAAGMFVFVVFALWLVIRLSLAGPANLASHKLGMAESWRLTRGRVWPIAGAALIAGCLFGLIAAVVWILTVVVQAAIGGFHSFAPVSLSDPEAMAQRPGAYAFGMLAELALGPVFWVIAAAPFAAIYRQLAARS